ncbi:MAG: hypothetical protein IPO32_14360 [Crocinitomicaceae bacterium]|nr:hypothetical protein [Crocinitomicaceae bacterium]
MNLPDGGNPMEKIEDIGYYDVAVVLGGMAEYDNTLDRLSMRRGSDRSGRQ